jgi:hypothetical protein
MRIAGLALLSAAASCSDATGPQHDATELRAARQRWQAQNLHTYAFTLQRSCFCGNVDPLYIVVVNDTVAGVLDLQTGAAEDLRSGVTVDGLFAFVQSAIDHHAQLIRAEYDGAKGFPTEIDYDGAAAIADDEITYRATDVHPVTPPQ